MVDHPWIVRADGTGLRALPGRPNYYTFAGPWLYSSEAQGVYRQHDLDEEPQLVVPSGTAGTTWLPSPDGEAIAYCKFDAPDGDSDCHVESPVGATAVPIPPPSEFLRWSPGGSWLLSPPCTIYDRASNSVWSCDSTSLAEPVRSFVDDAVFAFIARDGDGFAVHVHTIATGQEVVLPSLPWLPELTVTPDHSTVIVAPKSFFQLSVLGNEFVPILAASALGSHWATLAEDVDYVRIEPFGSVAIMESRSKGMIASVGGGPVHPAAPPGFNAEGWYSAPSFEPPGGLDKILFFGFDGNGVWQSLLGNAEGTGDWISLAPDLECSAWVGHAALCYRRTGEVFVIRDDGKAAQPIARSLWQWNISPRRFFFIEIWSQGLHVVENPWP